MRVALKTKNKGIKCETYPCRKCQEPIKAGEKYYEWKHRYAPPSRQHQTHGSPRQSELCTGKMSGVYAAQENVGDVIDAARQSSDCSGLADALTEAAESVREVAQEYEDNRSNMPEGLQEGPTGSDMQEKAEALNEFADSLESAASDSEITDWEADDEPSTMLDHTDDCAINKEVEEEGASDNEKCDCGFEDAESAYDEWETERDSKIEAACDAAQNAIDELSI